MLRNNIDYVVYDESKPSHIDVVDMVKYMDSNDMRDIVYSSNKDAVKEFMSKYSAENPYVKKPPEAPVEIPQGQLFAGRENKTAKREYPLTQNQALTEQERQEMLSEAFQNAGYILHAAFTYVGESRAVDALVTAKTGEKYKLSFEKIKQ